MPEFTEHPDRYEAEWQIGSYNTTVSIDKPISPDLLDKITQLLKLKSEELIHASLSFFESKKAEYGIEYIDDLSDPQIIAGPDSLDVYWSSDKGEDRGDCVIGIEFSREEMKPFQLVIGD
ncbi:MAG: hypothetical protein ACYTFI_03430 [Planctomycetota bacterium]|jgi:hypothetical protein